MSARSVPSAPWWWHRRPPRGWRRSWRKALDPDRFDGWEPDAAAEVAAPQEPALGRREHEPLGALLGPGPEVLLERVGDEARHRHRAIAGLALGRAGSVLAVDLGDLLDHRHRPRPQVYPVLPQPDQLTPAQPAVAGKQHQGAVARRDHGGQGVDLRRRGESHLRRALPAGTLDLPGGVHDVPVLDRGAHDPREQPVGLGDRRLADTRQRAELVEPLDRERVVDVVQCDFVECRLDEAAEQVAVEVACGRPQGRALQPLLGPPTERCLAALGVVVGAAELVGLDHGRGSGWRRSWSGRCAAPRRGDRACPGSGPASGATGAAGRRRELGGAGACCSRWSWCCSPRSACAAADGRGPYRLDPVGREVVGEVALVEADVAPDLVVRDAPFGDQAPHEAGMSWLPSWRLTVLVARACLLLVLTAPAAGACGPRFTVAADVPRTTAPSIEGRSRNQGVSLTRVGRPASAVQDRVAGRRPGLGQQAQVQAAVAASAARHRSALPAETRSLRPVRPQEPPRASVDQAVLRASGPRDAELSQPRTELVARWREAITRSTSSGGKVPVSTPIALRSGKCGNTGGLVS